MMRKGKILGSLNWKTNCIYLMGNSEKNKINEKYIKQIRNGKFIRRLK